MSTFPIAIDATRLFFRYFYIPGVTGETDARRVQTVQFAPGDYNYQVQSGVLADFTFTVTPQGTVDYDHSCDAFLGGRGTATLQLPGLEVTLDALSLTGADNGGGVLLASVGSTNDDWIERRTVRLLPQKPYWVQQSSGRVARLEFALQRDGRFSYAPELDTAQGGCLAGAGTTTLTFKGHTVSVDATAVSHLLLIQPIWGAKPAQNGKTTVVVLPADGFILQLDQGVTDLGFSVGITGAVTMNPEMTDWLGIVPGVAGAPPTVRVLHHPAPPQSDPPAAPRFCGVPDTPPQMLGTHPLSYGAPLGRWTRGKLTISVNATGCQGVNAGVVNNIVLSAYAQYQFQQGFFSFPPPGSPPGGPNSDIRVQFGGINPPPSPGGGEANHPPDGSIFLDTGNTWTPQTLLRIVLHEAGHTLGLSHSTLPSSVMYPISSSASLVKGFDGKPKIADPLIFNQTTGIINPSVNNTILDAETIEALQGLYGWLPQVRLADRASTDGPSLATAYQPAFGQAGTEEIFMAWKGGRGDSGLYFASSLDGINWSAQQNINGVGSSDGPALSTYHPSSPDGHAGLFMAWKGAQDDHNIYWAMNPNRLDNGWTAQQSINAGTSARPALAEFNQATLAWKGVPGDSGIYWSTFDGVNSWSPQQPIAGRGTSHGPAMVVFNRQLHMFWKGARDDNKVYHAILVDPVNGIWGPQEVVAYVDAGELRSGQTPVPIATSNAPVATVRANELILAWKGASDDHALWFSRFIDGSFSGQTSVANVGSEAGPGIGNLNGRLVLGWRGIGSDDNLWVSTLG